MNRFVLLSALSLAFAFFAFVPAADAQGPGTYPPCVYGVLHSPCFGDHDVCSPYASLQIPACVDIPGCHHWSCISIQTGPLPVPVSGPCVAGYTASSCLWGYDICGPTVSEEMPFCTNVPLCPHWECD
ncbi:MAG: hypothetical protein QOE90_2388 [Thermoplasmata archaeon]|jgi:hypothetical protein|nr:hypothetical protein [Thermoplasmata archaeon]